MPRTHLLFQCPLPFLQLHESSFGPIYQRLDLGFHLARQLVLRIPDLGFRHDFIALPKTATKFSTKTTTVPGEMSQITLTRRFWRRSFIRGTS